MVTQQMPLQGFEFEAVLQTDDMIGSDGFFDWDCGRLGLRCDWNDRSACKLRQSGMDGLHQAWQLR